MGKKTKVSIITPSYNKPDFVGDAIQSVLNQTYRDFEYIIIENSTNAETKKIVRSFKDERIKYFDEVFSDDQRKNFYVPAYILNKYYEKAKGDYIFYLSDDDVLLNDCLSIMVKFLDEHKDVKVCFHDQIILYQNNKKLYFESLARGTNRILSFNNKNPRYLDGLDGGQIMFKRQILKKIPKPYFPLDWKLAYYCDNIFMGKISCRNDFFPTKKILSIHRVLPSTTHRERNPLKYTIYRLAAIFTPEFIQRFLGTMTGKRRQLTKEEKMWFENFKKSYLVNCNF